MGKGEGDDVMEGCLTGRLGSLFGAFGWVNELPSSIDIWKGIPFSKFTKFDSLV